MARVIIVGAGLFGSVAAKLAQQTGHQVTVVDNSEPLRASAAAGCVLKPSWLSSIPKEESAAGIQLLDQLYGLRPLLFRSPLGVQIAASHVAPQLVLNHKPVNARVARVTAQGVVLSTGKKLPGKVLVAAGVWSRALCPEIPEIKSLVGASFRFPRKGLEPRLKVWAPYRQAVAFQITPTQVWFGDGTSILEKNWTNDYVVSSAMRAQQLFNLTGGKPTVGARPVVAGFKAGYFKRLSPTCWVSTGGAKNGIVLAAVQAIKWMEDL